MEKVCTGNVAVPHSGVGVEWRRLRCAATTTNDCGVGDYGINDNNDGCMPLIYSGT